jgi:mRNA-degrading endonuclease RelE of RelBE toxin-antitoxin system
MRHLALPRFWQHYRRLPPEVRKVADKNFELLKADPLHPSLHFKKVGRKKQFWSVRVGDQYRALAVEKPDGIVWFWIGSHAEYDQLLG